MIFHDPLQTVKYISAKINMMKAVIFKGPNEVAVEERPIPRIQDAYDIIVKVTYTAMYRKSVLYPTKHNLPF